MNYTKTSEVFTCKNTRFGNKGRTQTTRERKGEITYMTFSYSTFFFYHGELSHCGKQNEGSL